MTAGRAGTGAAASAGAGTGATGVGPTAAGMAVDAGLAKPEAIRAALPAQGKQLTFTGSLQVETWADLRIKLDAAAKSTRAWGVQILALAGLFTALAILAALTRRPSALDQPPA